MADHVVHVPGQRRLLVAQPGDLAGLLGLELGAGGIGQRLLLADLRHASTSRGAEHQPGQPRHGEDEQAEDGGADGQGVAEPVGVVPQLTEDRQVPEDAHRGLADDHVADRGRGWDREAADAPP